MHLTSHCTPTFPAMPYFYTLSYAVRNALPSLQSYLPLKNLLISQIDCSHVLLDFGLTESSSFHRIAIYRPDSPTRMTGSHSRESVLFTVIYSQYQIQVLIYIEGSTFLSWIDWEAHDAIDQKGTGLKQGNMKTPSQVIPFSPAWSAISGFSNQQWEELATQDG